jgi:hypothetical protein
MSIKIGRAGRDSGLALNSPSYWSVNGDDVELAGALTADSYVKLVILRLQVAGLADNRDEPVVAVNWAGDPSVDGYYEVLDASVPMPARGLAAHKLDYRVRLRRLAVHPDISSVISGNAVRANSHTIAKGVTVPWWATPADATMDHVTGASSATRVTDSGSVKVQYTTDGTLLYNVVRRWACLASDYYDGACRVEVTDGVGWYAAVGRPNILTVNSWRITNGAVRVSYGGGNGLLLVEHYISGAWSVAKTYKLTYTSTPTTLGAFSTVTVKDNRPECVTVRLGLERDSTAPYQMNVDLTIRRGALWCEGVVTRDTETGTEAIGIYRNTAEAATAHTSGVHATAADAQGGKYVLTTSFAKTNDLTQGGFYVSAGATTAVDFMVGYEPGTPTGPDTYANQVYSYFAPTDELVGFSRR